MMDIKDDVNNNGDSETFQDWWKSLAQPWTDECAKTAAYQAWQQRSAHVTRLQAEVERLREQSNARLFTLAKVQSELTKLKEDLRIEKGYMRDLLDLFAHKSAPAAKDD